MITLIIIGLIVIAVALFSAQNAAPVAVSFLAWHFTASLSIVVLLSFLIGALVGMAVLSWTNFRRSMKKKERELAERSSGKL